MRAVIGLVLALLATPLVAHAAQSCARASFEGAGFTVCRYHGATDQIRLALKGPSGVLGGFSALKAALGADAPRVLFAMNAGMYEPSRAPVGLLIQSGQLESPLQTADGTGNFYLKPNGVFWVAVDGAVHIDEASAFAAAKVQPQWATQSGPLLVKGGVLHPLIAADGPSLAIRNGVGVRSPSEAVFVISDQPVSFSRLARFLRDSLGCPDALYFDGVVSSLWAPGLGRVDGRTGLGPLLVVLKTKPPA